MYQRGLAIGFQYALEFPGRLWLLRSAANRNDSAAMADYGVTDSALGAPLAPYA
jgi:hypothetical protein